MHDEAEDLAMALRGAYLTMHRKADSFFVKHGVTADQYVLLHLLARARVPISLPTDRDVIAACLDTCWRIDPAEARLVVIPNTLELTTLWVSEPLAADVDAIPGLSIDSGFLPIPIDAGGRLDQEQLFPESVRGRRRVGRSTAPAGETS